MINIGTVMELYKNEVLVMTVEFDLVRVKRKSGMFLGQQVRFRKSDVISSDVRKMTLIGVAAVLVVAFIAVYVLQGARLGIDNAVYAIVGVDINPSMEFLINDTNIVQKVLPLNSDAESIAKDISLKDLPINEAIERVIVSSQEAGKLNSDKNNVIMLSVSLNPKYRDYKRERGKVELKINELLANLNSIHDNEINKEYTIKVIKLEPEIKKHAEKNGLSAGRQLILEKAQVQGIVLSLDEVKTGNLSDLMDKVGMDEGVFISQNPGTPVIKSPARATARAGVTPTNGQKTSTKTSTPAPDTQPTVINPTGEGMPHVPINTTPANTKTPDIPVGASPTDSKTQDLSTGSIKLQHYNPSKKANNVYLQINADFSVINTGDKVIDLEDVTIRYYYTIDSEETQVFDCWAQEGKANITHRFVKMSTPVDNADYYLEIGFKGGQLAPGESTRLITWFTKEDWSSYNQDNDYSYDSSKQQDCHDWKYITGYIKGVLKWGIEPEN